MITFNCDRCGSVLSNVHGKHERVWVRVDHTHMLGDVGKIGDLHLDCCQDCCITLVAELNKVLEPYMPKVEKQ